MKRLAAGCLALMAMACPAKDHNQNLAPQVRSEIQRRAPDVKITILDPHSLQLEVADGSTLTMHLHNLEASCDAEPDHCSEALEAHVKSTLEQLRQLTDPALSTELLRATLKNDDYMKSVRELDAPGADSANNRLVSKRLAGDVWTVVVVDMPTSMRMLNYGDLAELQISADEAMTDALKNLDSLPEVEPTVLKDSKVRALITQDSYGSARMLLVDRWKKRTSGLDGDLVAAVPARDVVLYTGSQNSEDVAALHLLARRMSDKEAYGLSSQLFRFTGDGWEPYSPEP